MLCRVALRTQMVKQGINSAVYIEVLIEHMNNPLGVSPSKGNQGTTRGKGKKKEKKVRESLSLSDLVAQSAE